LLSIDVLEKSLENSRRSIKENNIESDDVKSRARILRGFLEESATGVEVELKLRKKEKKN